MDLYLVKTGVYLDDRTIKVDVVIFEDDQAAIEDGFTQKDCDRARAVCGLGVEIEGLNGRLTCAPMTKRKDVI